MPAILATLVVAVLALDAPAAPCEVLLNEILAAPTQDWNTDGTVSSRDDEWVELINIGTAEVDLSAFMISDKDSTIRFRFAGSLSPGARAVVFGSDAVAWQQANDRTSSGLSLNNSGDTVRLWQVAGAETLMVDAYAYKSHETSGDRASGRQPDGGTWVIFDGLNPYSGSQEPAGNGCEPTVGQPNECVPTQTSENSWGVIKSVYR